MGINWKVRFRNPAWLTGFLGFIIATVYQLLNLLGVNLGIPQETWVQFVGLAVQLLTLLGVLVDPTTAGLGDSPRALGYKVPMNTKENK